MKKPFYCFPVLSLFFLVIPILFSCHKSKSYKNPIGYDFAQPEKIFLNHSLDEISGIAFTQGNDVMLYAINDEEGQVYYFKPRDEKYNSSKFGKRGDYEDLTVYKNQVVVLRSDGSLFSFPIESIGEEKLKNVNEYPKILPKGEYEGMYAEGDTLYVLCKNCPEVGEKSQAIIYTLELASDATLHVIRTLVVDLSAITHENKPIKFRPSGIAKNPVTNEWYIISAVNKMLIVLDTNWKLKEYFALAPTLFKQPEGMAFNTKGDLFISNEIKVTAANILVFRYSAP